MILHLDRIDDPVSAEKSTVGGNVYLQIGDAYFPEENWYDIASLIFENWFPALCSFLHGSTDFCKLTFWDGPCYVKLHRDSDLRITAECVYDNDRVIAETAIDFLAFVRSAIKAGNKFCRLLHAQGRDCEPVSSAVGKLKNELRTIDISGPY